SKNDTDSSVKKVASLVNSDIETASTAKNGTSTSSASTNNASELFKAKPIPKLAAKKSSRNWLLPTFIALLLLVTLIFTSWTAYQQKQFQENWSQLQTNVNDQIERQTQTIQQMKTTTDLSIQTINRTQLQLNQLSANNQNIRESLLSTQERIKSLSGRQKQDWMLAEAAYLIKIAQLQLSLQKDKTTAIQLLRSADRLILQMTDDNLTPIRKAIAKDISDIGLILEADQTGISLALNAISLQVPHLNIIALELSPLDQSISTPEMTEDSSLNLSNIYQQFLKDFIVIKDHSEPVKPLMTPDQRANLKSNIQLAIQQAQIALATGNERLYRLNIENAIVWSKDFFKLDEKTKQIVNQLEELKLKIVETHYPEQLKAKQALEEVSRQQLYQWLDASLSNSASQLSSQPTSNSLQEEINQTIGEQEKKEEPKSNIDRKILDEGKEEKEEDISADDKVEIKTLEPTP
ncbi:MAG: uroporphyrinogen-III C-methyltransferase, partial [Kangiellaceae bacterium]|nr:uroporphyrinogen-III C-methyltransferase [Kangiellaceae bacterium]